jgi:hypothetical protein
MNWMIQHLKDPSYVKIIVEGKFDVSVHLRNIEEITLQEEWSPGLNLLFDCTMADFDGTRFQDVQQLANNFVKNDLFVGCGKVAILMQGVTDFGKGRQFEMMTGEQICADIHIFLNENQALRWLKT